MRWLRFVVLLLLAVVLQASLLSRLDYKPDLLLIFMVFVAIYCNSHDAIILSFCIGFAADLIGAVMGPQIISFSILGMSISYLHHYIAIKRMSYQWLLISVVGCLSAVLTYLLLLLKGSHIPPVPFTGILISSLISGLVGPFLFPPFAWWMQIKTHRYGRK